MNTISKDHNQMKTLMEKKMDMDGHGLCVLC